MRLPRAFVFMKKPGYPRALSLIIKELDPVFMKECIGACKGVSSFLKDRRADLSERSGNVFSHPFGPFVIHDTIV